MATSDSQKYPLDFIKTGKEINTQMGLHIGLKRLIAQISIVPDLGRGGITLVIS